MELVEKLSSIHVSMMMKQTGIKVKMGHYISCFGKITWNCLMYKFNSENSP